MVERSYKITEWNRVGVKWDRMKRRKKMGKSGGGTRIGQR